MRNLVLNRLGAVAFAAVGFASAAFAEDYPTKPVTFVVGYSAGGTADTIARTMAAEMEKQLGQPVIVENKPGGGSAVAADYVANADADGYTVLIGLSALTINPALKRPLNYDVEKDFTPVAMMGRGALGLLVNKDQPFSTVQELVDYAKAHPGELSYGSSGIGTSPHMIMELFKAETGIDMVHIPYKGGAPAMAALLAGEVQVEFDSLLPIQSSEPGAIKLLGTTMADRTSIFPDTPTIAESGLPGFDQAFWIGALVPSGTPDDIVALLNEKFNVALGSEAITTRYGSLAIAVSPGSPEDFASFLAAETEQWNTVAERAGLAN